MMMMPTCAKCGLEMTPQNARHRPELFLHDACLPDELRPSSSALRMWQCDKIKELADKWLSDDAAGYEGI